MIWSVILSYCGLHVMAEICMKSSKYHIILMMYCSLNLEQKELCRVRVKLLTYLDRLATYEVRLPSTITPTPMYLALYHVQEPSPPHWTLVQQWTRSFSYIQLTNVLASYGGLNQIILILKPYIIGSTWGRKICRGTLWCQILQTIQRSECDRSYHWLCTGMYTDIVVNSSD